MIHYYLTGYRLATGDYFSKRDFEKVFDEIEKNESEYTCVEKLNRHALLLHKGSQVRQNVRRACQLFSRCDQSSAFQNLAENNLAVMFSLPYQ